MKITNLKKGLLATAALGFFAAGAASAQVTPAGDTVSNTFTLNYEVDGGEQPEITNSGDPTTFVVDRLIDLTVANIGSPTPVATGQSNAVTTFTVTNDGNGIQDYVLDVVNGLGTEDFDPEDPAAPVVAEITYELSSNPGVIETYNAADLPQLGPDEFITVTVVQDIPTGEVDGNLGEIILLAETRTDAGDPLDPADADGNDLDTEENIFADAAGPDAGDNILDGQHSATGVYVINDADVTGVKTVSIIAEDGDATGFDCATDAALGANEYSLPGACIEYVITVTNSDTRDATAIAVVDNLPSELTFVAATSAGFAAATPGTLSTPTLGDDCDTDGCTISLTGATLPAPTGSATETIGTVTIRALLK